MAFTRWLMETDDGSLTRGRAYAHEGRVEIRQRSATEVSAVVRGSTSYDVSVSDEHAFCTCPVGLRGAICKHVVAVVMMADHEPVAAGRDESDAEAATAPRRPVTLLSEEEMRSLVTSLGTRGFLDYQRAIRHGQQAHEVVDRLEQTLDERSADTLRPLLERAVGGMILTLLRSDDSSGVQGDATGRLLDLHAQASRLGAPDPLKLARWLSKITYGDDGFFALDPVEYAEPLGDRGLAAYRLEAEQRLAADPDEYHAKWVLERFAVLSGDVDQIVARVGGPLEAPYQYQRLVEALLEIGATDQALRYAREGAAKGGAVHQVTALVDTAVELLEEQSDAAGAVTMRQELLRRAPSLTAYTALRRTASKAGTWPAERLDALDVLIDRNPEDWLRALLHDGDADLAWEASTTMAVGPHLRLELLRTRARTAPADVFDGYVEVIDQELAPAGADHYRQGVRLLGELRRACVSAGRVPEYDAYVADLLERHRRRPTLVRLLTSMPSP